MQKTILIVSCVALTCSVAMAQTERRELGAHVHGAGTLSIAIEGSKVSMDLSAPANDILGFEHQPSTAEQTKALAAAKAALSQPLKLFEMPAAAGCTTETANVTFNAAGSKTEANPSQSAKSEEQGHADFDVDYVLNCKAPEKITSLQFPYFKQFAGAQKLAVTLVSDKGQFQFDVTRDTPRYDVNP